MSTDPGATRRERNHSDWEKRNPTGRDGAITKKAKEAQRQGIEKQGQRSGGRTINRNRGKWG